MSKQKLYPSLFSERYDDFASRFLCSFNGNDKSFFPLRKVMEEYYGYNYQKSCSTLRDEISSYGCKAYIYRKEVYVDMRSIRTVYFSPKQSKRALNGKGLRGQSVRGTRLLHIVLDVALMKAGKFGVGNQWSVEESYEIDPNARPVQTRSLFIDEDAPKKRNAPAIQDAPTKKAVSLNVVARLSVYSFVESDKSISTSKQGV